jgi:alpha-L-rhamnosidase
MEIRFAPIFPEGLGWVKASYDCPYGTIRSEWKKQDGGVEWNITVPPNTSAMAKFPDGTTKQLESGRHTFTIPEQRKP